MPLIPYKNIVCHGVLEMEGDVRICAVLFKPGLKIICQKREKGDLSLTKEVELEDSPLKHEDGFQAEYYREGICYYQHN